MGKYTRIVFMVVAILCFGVTFIGCGGVKVKPTALETMGAPEWTYKGGGAFKKEKEHAFYGVGLVSGIQNRALAITTADNRARNEIAKRFEVFISSLMKDYAASTTANDFKNTAEEQHIEQAIKTVTTMTLSGVEIVDHWEVPQGGDYYSLARLDVESFKNNLEKMETLNENVRDFVRKNADRLHEELSKEEDKAGTQ